MKKLSLPQNKFFRNLWIVYHALIFAGFLCLLCVKRDSLKIDADLFNILPKPETNRAVKAADKKLTEITGQNVFILAANEDFSAAKAAAETVYSKLNGNPKFKSISLYQDMSAFADIVDFAYRYRWNLLDETAVQTLENGGAETFAQNALAAAYSGFTVSSLENLETDPFLLTEYNIRNYLSTLQNSGTSMSLKDGVLAARADGQWYVMIQGILSKEGTALASKNNAVVQIREACDPLEKDGTRFIYSGTPFHSYKSSSSAAREISVISVVSMLIVFLILLFIFKRPQPILYSLGSIVVAILTALCATLLVFRNVHILTLIFGTSLIGSCIDYSLHYFISWKGNKSLHSGGEIRAHLLKGLALSMLSTEMCYLMLVFTPFNLLKQIALFSISGIMSAFLTVIGLYPYIPVPDTGRDIRLRKIVKTPQWYNKKLVGRIMITLLFAGSAVTLLVCRNNIRIQNNISRLYKLEGRELENEAEALKVLSYHPSGWFIVSGGSAEETLKNEERLAAGLRQINDGKKMGGFICTSMFIPSVAAQNRSRAAAENLLPLAASQYEALGYSAENAAALSQTFISAADSLILPESKIPEIFRASVSSVWLGQIGDKYYSVVLPVSVTDEAAYRQLASENPGVSFINKVKNMNRDLDILTNMILRLFLIVYVILFVILKFFYTWKQTFKITSVPLLIVLITASVFSIFKIDLEFFSVTGMILVFGLGLDYIIYMIENEKRMDETENGQLEPFAILLSFLTTCVSFGALALSNFVPVHMIGLSIFIGLTTAFLSTFFYTRAEFNEFHAD